MRKANPMNRISPADRSSVADSSPFDPEPGCLLDWGLYCVACDCRGAILTVDEGPRAIELAQLALDVEKLRRKHYATCSECNPGAA